MHRSTRTAQLLTLFAMSHLASGFRTCTVGASTSLLACRMPMLHGSRHSTLREPRWSWVSTAPTPPSFSNLRGGGGNKMASGGSDGKETLVQYVVLRRDLAQDGWPMGSIVAQGCHAVSAALWEMRDEENVIEYCKDIDNMHKVVLGARDEKTLRKVAQKLEEQGLKHRLWIEQPEDYATALAVMPYPRSTIAPHLKKLSLLK